LLNSLPGVLPPPADSNGNGVDDAADIVNGTSQDMDWDGIPDECEPGCNGNGRPDDFDVANDVPDCNHNGRPDSCDLADGTSQGINGNRVPDDCDPDCNGNGVPDDLDILNGTSQDLNGDGVPDECTPLTGDMKQRSCGLADAACHVGVLLRFASNLRQKQSENSPKVSSESVRNQCASHCAC
jgi:hypothetical protein